MYIVCKFYIEIHLVRKMTKKKKTQVPICLFKVPICLIGEPNCPGADLPWYRNVSHRCRSFLVPKYVRHFGTRKLRHLCETFRYHGKSAPGQFGTPIRQIGTLKRQIGTCVFFFDFTYQASNSKFNHVCSTLLSTVL
jgi:hypothetical protein